MEDGIFPEKLKIAKVIPLFKAGEKNLFTNYRPISVLSVFSKLLEKLIHKRLYDFIEEHQILYIQQFGFRKDHSTFMAVLTFVENIRTALENGEYSIGLFLDLSKAFDTINHEIYIMVEEGTQLNNLIANFDLSTGASAFVNSIRQESGISSNDFRNPVTYAIIAEDGQSEQSWVVYVSIKFDYPPH